MSEMCCKRLAGNTGRKKIAIRAASHNFVRLYLRNEGMYRQSKKLLNSSISSTCSHNMVNFGPLTAEIGSLFWGTPANFNRLRVLVTAPTSLNEGQQNFAGCLAAPCACILYIHRRGLLPPNGILPAAKFTLRPSLTFSYIGSVTALTRAAAVSQTLWRGTRNGITELSQRAPLIFGWAAIMLGIGPHSSCKFTVKSHS